MDKKKLLLYLILLFCLSMRLCYVFFFPQMKVASDPKGYDEMAVDLIQKGEFTEWRLNQRITRPPGYPLFLAAVYFFSGHNYTAVRFWQCLFGMLTVFFIYLICKRLFDSEITVLSAVFLTAFHPALIGYTGLLFTETMFTFFLVISIYFLQSAVRYGKYVHFGTSGFFLGITALISSRIIYFPFFLSILFLVISKDKLTALKKWFIMLFFLFLTISPWTIRNYLVTGKFILLESYHNAALWFATNPYDIHEWGKEPLKKITEGKTPAEIEKVMHEEGKRHLKEHPFIYLRNSAKRFFRLWFSGHSNIFLGMENSFIYAWKLKDIKLFFIKFLFLSANVILISIGFAGIFLAGFKKIKDCIIVISPVAYFSLLHSFTVAAPRLSVPILPFILVFSALALERILKRFSPDCL